jgi:hypothetical protein
VLQTSTLRVLSSADLPSIWTLFDRDPVANVFVASRVRAAGPERSRLGGELWGHFVEDTLVAACYYGANLVPVEAGPASIELFAEQALRRQRRCASLVGPHEAVSRLWEILEPRWGPAREVRPQQPVMVTSERARVPADPQVRRVRMDELDILMPASTAMFTEEVGVSPVEGDGGVGYRARVAELIEAGRAFARIEDAEVVFKAEIGSVSDLACQVQGVWVRPERRGHGLSVGGMAAVVNTALAEVAPAVSLYVNDYNLPARAAYRRVGMSDAGMFMSVLF